MVILHGTALEEQSEAITAVEYSIMWNFGCITYTQITPLSHEMLWLGVNCVQFKALVVNFEALNGTGPWYLQYYLSPAWQLGHASGTISNSVI